MSRINEIMGMSNKELNILKKLMSTSMLIGSERKFLTVSEFLKKHPDTKIERRISKNGIKLIKVFYKNRIGEEYFREYQEDLISQICSYKYE